MPSIKDSYKKLPDKEIVSLILQGNEEAVLYLLYDKYYEDLRFYVNRYYHSLFHLEELISELYIHLKGKELDWNPLKSFLWKSIFKTWFCRVASNLFLEKREVLIGLSKKFIYKDVTRDDVVDTSSETQSERFEVVLLLEAISRLTNSNYKFVIIKGLEGYSPMKICIMLTEKKRQEGRLKVRKSTGKEILPTVEYIYMIKSRALKEISSIMNEIKTYNYDTKL